MLRFAAAKLASLSLRVATPDTCNFLPVLCLIFLLIFPIAGLAADGTTPKPLTVSPLDRALAIIAPYSGDANGNNTLLVEWDEAGGDWATPLGRRVLAHSASPYACTLAGLDNGRSYQVRLTWQDSDNLPGEQIRSGLIPYNPLVHSSLSTGSSQWGSGGWGVAGGRYGEFTCATCHRRGVPNIKRIRPELKAPGPEQFPIQAATPPANQVSFTDTRDGTADFGDDNGGHATSIRICEACHSRTRYHRYDTTADPDGTGPLAAQADLGHYNRTDCIACHKHRKGFAHGAAGSGCEPCHGHDPGYEYGPGQFSSGAGSVRSHSTHTENDADDVKGPNLACGACHDTGAYPFFISGTDADGDGRFNLAETDVCDPCHSPDGPLDGVNDATIGARNNWAEGVYSAATLAAGKKRWCAGCHDAGRAIVNGRQAPDVVRDNAASGYYLSGHGAMEVVCDDCHGVAMSHNFDGARTYTAAANNYQAGYRLKDVANTAYGSKPLNIPNPNGAGLGCRYDQADFNLCYQCHNPQTLLNDTRDDGVYECRTNPYRNAATITTGFRNMLAAGMNGGEGDWPANIHWDHLADINALYDGNFWDSDRDGSADSKAGCITCHDPHGAPAANDVPTRRMTRQELQIEWGTDPVYGSYGAIGANAKQNAACTIVCHGNGVRYYRPATTPVLASLAALDADSADPAPASTGYTNNRTVSIALTLGGGTATQMRLAEDADFTRNATDWTAYASPCSYTLSSGDGAKNIYARIRNGVDLSDVKSATIVLDTILPTVSATTLTAPDGGETWVQDSRHDITWNGIADANLNPHPVALNYSTDGGATFPYPITASATNDGIFPWIAPPVESARVRVRIVATDLAGNQAADTSNRDFTIAALAPTLEAVSLADSDAADPAPAESGYTNRPAISVNLSASNHPTLMRLSEDPTFASAPWVPFAAASTFVLSAGDGSKLVYCQVKNGTAESKVQSAAIILDRTAPGVPLLTAPAAGEFWTRATDRSITWLPASIADPSPGSLKALPLALAFSTDNGTTYPAIIADGIANSGSYTWRTPVAVSYTAKIRLTVTDRAGNQSAGATGTFRVSPPDSYIVATTADSGAGSLRQAMADLVAAGGNDSIWFNIPASDPGFTHGVAVVAVTSAALPPLSRPGMIIDGDSQRMLRGDTNPSGPEVRLHGTYRWTGLDVTADDVTVSDLQLTGWSAGFRTNAARTTLAASHVGFSSDATGFDGTNPRNYGNIRIDAPATATRIGGSGMGNYISCAWLSPALEDSGTGTLVVGNVFGLLPDGTACSNSSLLALDATACTVRDNVICGGSTGIYIYGSNNVIQGNTMGVWRDGTIWRDCIDQYEAIRIHGGTASGNLIGGPRVASGDDQLNDSNVIDPGSYGIRYIAKGAAPDFIFGNFIGTNPGQDQTFPGSCGIDTGSQLSVRIGGSEVGESGNVIAHMTGNGVYLSNAAGKYIRISRNSFYGNGTNADFSDDAILLASGANQGVTRPVISSITPSTVTVTGVASGNIVEIYRSDFNGTGTAYGEGRTFIAAAVATSSVVDVDVSTAGLALGEWLTATQSNAAGSTSAFSANVQVP